MNGKVRQRPQDTDWARLLDAERALEAQIAAAQTDARQRVAQARAAAAAATPDAVAMASLATEQQQVDTDQQRGELAHIAEQADTAARALAQAPDSLVDALACLALDAVLSDKPAAERR